ncbi:MAG TPA: DUF1735 domain-containing protein [Puia sp.]|uniref:DUF1735 domain-containing protein n=1 Tax=Puia sp. TaxID=2045100 RepID=UPI002CF849EF|nr:DUF1735 domain-containing protein [Puia sp.]HVU93816.1 DUF1735 domain-containing protein [Puia sp.]
MKRISIISASLVAISLSACLKDKPNTDFTGTQSQYVAEISTASTNATPNAPSGGIQYFGGATLSLLGTDLDSVMFTVNIASDYPPTKDIQVTLAVDPSAIASYNAGGYSSVTYSQMPDSIYTFAQKTGTIKAGSRLDTFYVVFDPTKVDLTQSYMLPISITAAPGTIISGNMGTIYFHMIGNPLAGPYNSVGFRYNYTGSIGYTGGPYPSGGAATNLAPLSPKFGTPIDQTTLSIDYANLGPGDYYVISYDKSNPDTISVTVNKSFLNSISHFGVITQSYNHLTKTMHIVTTYNNQPDGSGNDRIVDETFVHQ